MIFRCGFCVAMVLWWCSFGVCCDSCAEVRLGGFLVGGFGVVSGSWCSAFLNVVGSCLVFCLVFVALCLLDLLIV